MDREASYDGGVRRAHPSAGLTPDGRRMQVVTSYTRRGSRLTSGQQAAWERRSGQWLVPDAVASEGHLDQRRYWGRAAPDGLVMEIGSGNGEVVAALAAERPEANVLACEVWRPGVAATFLRLEETGLTNVRLLALDAVWVLEHLLRPGELAELWTFFPDPWHKARHHKRRLVTPRVAALVADRLRPGGVWRIATDWPDYAEQVDEVLAGEPRLVGGRTERWAERPVTKFERRGLAEGRPIADWTATREP
ncbi:tRNA (guanosine(46)-N7)-methyltransferase TrmB [Nocardioides marmoribigeumensis]|uniref:tRNA (guanine-N(7)-)-methyltransferase n=1 Tax=Nocardioides marmoribigeumensis TaxID=433649 RepID=A0ABU2BWC5_9ACTN|nr:tRNA (guanosine(46)-N7)-methyltransferase TrmB [Nocardioides marmoribigeumensis]MDR7362937.1 tRNA (guanine-N7-)-methyltransferase [Nocardioides marmoribigeumensis]